MITIYSIKSQFQKALKPCTHVLFRMGITPNQVTLFTILLSIGFGLYFGWMGKVSWWLMPLIFLVRMALNAIDGMLAKQFQMQSQLGIYLNELGDMVSDLFLYFPFALEFPWLMGSVIILGFLSEVAGILGIATSKERRYDGPMGKSDRAFCLGIMGLFMSFDLVTDVWAIAIFLGIIFSLSITIFFRIKRALSKKC